MGHSINLKHLEHVFEELPPLLKAEHLEAHLQIDRKTVYAMASRGELPYVRIGRAIRFPKRQVLAWLAQHTYIPPRLANLYALET